MTPRVRNTYERLVESLCVAGVLGVVLAFALQHVAPALLHVKLTEPLWFMNAVRSGIHEQHAITGRWPGEQEAILSGAPPHHEAPVGATVRGVEIGGAGVINFAVDLPDSAESKRLSLRIAQTGDALSPVIGLCGYAQAPPGYEALGRNETDVPESALPAPCRDRPSHSR